VPVLGSDNLSRTYPVSWLDMSESLTPQREDSFWGYKRMPTPLSSFGHSTYLKTF
jgi:hypothetical protein